MKINGGMIPNLIHVEATDRGTFIVTDGKRQSGMSWGTLADATAAAELYRTTFPDGGFHSGHVAEMRAALDARRK
jgi:hypothetical protein